MKKTVYFASFVLYAVMSAATVYADLSINIKDTNSYDSGDLNLYQLFNNYFSGQLGAEGYYASSNALFAARGVDPYTNWITSGSQLVGAYKVAALNHKLSLIDSEGNIHGNLYSATNNVSSALVGIENLSSQAVTNIPDGLNVSFQLDAFNGGNFVYSWSSNPDENDGRFGGNSNDEMVHMIAIDVTDLYNAKFGTENDSVFMFCWEDLHLYGAGAPLSADWDYQDFVVIMTNLKPGNWGNQNPPAVPEPATMVIFGLGLAGLAWARRSTKRK